MMLIGNDNIPRRRKWCKWWLNLLPM